MAKGRKIRVLTHPRRTRVLAVLAGHTASQKEMPVELSKSLKGVSCHMGLLVDAGLVAGIDPGRPIFFRRADEADPREPA